MQNGKNKRKYRIFLGCLLIGGFASLLAIRFTNYYRKIPQNLKIWAGEEEQFNWNIPASAYFYKEDEDVAAVNGTNQKAIPDNAIFIDLNKAVTLKAKESDTYKMDVKLFGILPFKTVNVDVIENTKLIPAGIPIGIYIKTEGVLVIGSGDFLDENGNKSNTTNHILQSGDYIVAVNGVKVDKKKEVIEQIKASEGNEIIFTVIRQKEKIDLKVKPIKSDSGDYKVGIWIRDSAQGIGTLTFIDENGNFGALGHGINDIDTSTLMDLEGGNLYKTEIVGITKGQSGEPGELTGTIDYRDENIIGSINKNSNKGIFGVCNQELLSSVQVEALPIGLKQEVEKGPAQILCTIDGTTKYYDIAIEEIHYNSDNVNRGIVLKITDKELLSLTGGIVQGMSGSPIIQNGKIIGAVTHVLVQDSTRGYGIFIEAMLSEEYSKGVE